MISAVIYMSLTSLICHVLMHCLGSFLLQDMLLCFHEFTCEGQNMKFTVNLLLTCILYCELPVHLYCDAEAELGRLLYFPRCSGPL